MTREALPEILYEDNHLIAVNKPGGLLVQGDKTGDKPLIDILKFYIKEKYKKPGNVFLGVVHRLDRPTSGVVIMARTSKALQRMNQLFANRALSKEYWAIIPKGLKEQELRLEHWLLRKQSKNKSFAYDHEKTNSKKAILKLTQIHQFNRYSLLSIQLETGRHHQIRCQLAQIGFPIKGDLKYGAPRSNQNGCIDLHARKLLFIHPVTKENISITAPSPKAPLWSDVLSG